MAVCPVSEPATKTFYQLVGRKPVFDDRLKCVISLKFNQAVYMRIPSEVPYKENEVQEIDITYLLGAL